MGGGQRGYGWPARRWGGGSPDRLSVYRANNSGSLTLIQSVATGNNPFGSAITPNRKFVYVSNPEADPGFANGSISAFAVNALIWSLYRSEVRAVTGTLDDRLTALGITSASWLASAGDAGPLLDALVRDNRLEAAYRLVRPERRRPRWMPAWRAHSGAVRGIRELAIEATSLFERADNALKLIGDQYLSRVFDLANSRFHLDEWQQSIQRKLDTVGDVYDLLVQQSSGVRMEVLELTVVLLILIEIILAFRNH